MELRSRGLNNRPCAGRVDVLWEWGNEENEKEPTDDESLLHNSRDSSRHGLQAIPSIFLLPFNLACHLDGSTDGEETGRQREREQEKKDGQDHKSGQYRRRRQTGRPFGSGPKNGTEGRKFHPIIRQYIHPHSVFLFHKTNTTGQICYFFYTCDVRRQCSVVRGKDAGSC